MIVLEIGKLAGKKLKETILNKIDHFRSDVLVPAGPGEDSSVIDLGDYLLVVSSDPITGAEKNAGYLAVNVASNDIAAAGAEPFGIQVVLLLPTKLGEEKAEKLMNEIVKTAKSMNIEVLGGHTEITDLVEKPIITVTALGKAKKDELTSSSDAEAGDVLYITKGMGIEGSYILANDYPEYLKEKGVSENTLKKVDEYINLLSVIPESRIARKNGVKAMHDVTEGGVYGAVAEMASAAELGYIIEEDTFETKPEVAEICNKLGINPAALISSGSMLMAAAPDNNLENIFEKSEIDVFRVGKLIENADPQDIHEAIELKGIYELNGYEIEERHVNFNEKPPEEFSMSEFTEGIVFVDKRQDREIKSEGLAQEVVRRVQEMRKDLDLDLEERIEIEIDIEEAELIQEKTDYIKKETRADSLEFKESPSGYNKDWDKINAKIGIKEV